MLNSGMAPPPGCETECHMTWNKNEAARAGTSAQDCASSQLGPCALQRPSSGGAS